MRITAITDEISQDLGVALDVLKEYGATSCELRNVYGVYIVDADDALLARVETDLATAGMTVDCLDTPLFKCNLDAVGTSDAAGATHNAAERTLSDQWPLLDRCIELAIRFKTPYMRVFAFWRKGDLTADRRVAIIEAVDKITAESMRFEVEVGGRPVRFNQNLIFAARACEVTTPDELTEDAIAYMDVSLQARGRQEGRQIFRGWMFASSPAVSGIQNPYYDAWVVGCKN